MWAWGIDNALAGRLGDRGGLIGVNEALRLVEVLILVFHDLGWDLSRIVLLAGSLCNG